jgi:hypothetical protein
VDREQQVASQSRIQAGGPLAWLCPLKDGGLLFPDWTSDPETLKEHHTKVLNPCQHHAAPLSQAYLSQVL